MQIAIRLDPTRKQSLQLQIYEQIATYIRAGRFKPGSMLPSSRELSEQLGISRNTVSQVYEKLSADGYISTAPARGTFVSNTVPEDAMSARAMQALERSDRISSINLPLPYTGRGLPGLYALPHRHIRIDFRFGRSDAQSLLHKTWRRLLLECLGGAPERITQYNDPAGIPELREHIASYLGPSRGITVPPEQIIVVGGFQQGISLAAHLMVGVRTPIVIEAPCYRGAAFLFETFGGKVIPVPVDRFGIDVNRLPGHKVKMIYVTPSHQFPTGDTMSLERRLALLEWAAHSGAYILEVDYDSDFRYEGTLLPSLYSLDSNECVIYLNSFSRSIGPGLRLGYMVVPRDLLRAATTLKALIDNGSSWLEQATLARFIESGSLSSHLKRLRNTCRVRRDALRCSIEKYFGEANLRGEAGGTHMLWALPGRYPSAAQLRQVASSVGIGLHPLRSEAVLYEESVPDFERHVLLGYVHLKPIQIEEGLTLVAGALAKSR
jgi:GntR family transcriptional regulator/MocR family aminotransferase